MNKPDIYILQQAYDTNGVFIKKGQEVERPTLANIYFTHKSTGIEIEARYVVNEPDWFLPKEENKKQSTTIYGNLNQSIDAILALEKNMERIFEVAKKASEAMKKEAEKENVTLEDCYKAIELSKVRSEITLNPGSNKSDVEFQTHNFPLSCLERGNQLIAICALMAVADYVNGECHWKPELDQGGYHFRYDQKHKRLEILINFYARASISFKTREGAEEARLILGTETIKTALGL